MIDIAERLRNHVGMLEAADEIERLRQENDKLSEVRGTDQNRFVLELERAEKVIEVARSLWYNRLGHGDPEGPWHSPQDFWKDLHEALAEYDRGEGLC